MSLKAPAHYRFIDYAVQAYVLTVGLLVLVFGARITGRWWLLIAHLGTVGLVHGIVEFHAHRPENRLADFLRHFYPILLYTPFYRETGLLNRMFVSQYLDGFFLGLDRSLFGFQPSIALMQNLPHPAISELLYAFYFSYYVMIVGTGLALYLRDKKEFFRYVSLVSFVFYICYLVYIFLPVAGARIFYSPLEGFPQQSLSCYPLSFPDAVREGVFFRLMKFIYRHFEAEGAAFPSSHVAVALATLFFSWQHFKKVRWVHGFAVVMLMVSTVYCRYHYVVDVFAGVVVGLGLLAIGNRLYQRAETGLTD